MHSAREVTCVCSPAKKRSEKETPHSIHEKQKLNHVGCLTTREEKRAVKKISKNPRVPASWRAMKALTSVVSPDTGFMQFPVSFICGGGV